MKKFIFAITTTVLCLTGISFAAQETEFNSALDWLIHYYVDQRDPNEPYSMENDPKMKAHELMDEISAKIKQDFPMDQKLQDALTDVQQKKDAALLAFAQKYGYSSVKEMEMKIKQDFEPSEGSAIYNELYKIQQDYDNMANELSKAYNVEFQNRFQSACVEAIKRIQENANAMK
jgi:hypothetical protein